MSQKEVVLFWSGGKDSALTLYQLKQQNYKIKALITTINKENNTVDFHGISESLLVEQAKLIGIPLHRVFLSPRCTNIEYKKTIESALRPYLKRGIDTIAFGDFTLQDVKTFREQLFHPLGFNTLFPLWDLTLPQLQSIFFDNNFRAVITSINPQLLSHNFLGKELTQELLTQLPTNVSSFGENGEFHTIVTYAPFFKLRLPTSISITKADPPYEICQIRLP